MLWKNDNHFLTEWRACHYQVSVASLRRLIIAVDPSARTSPTKIWNRYRLRNLMTITLWSDEDYFPAVTGNVKFENRTKYEDLSSRGKVDLTVTDLDKGRLIETAWPNLNKKTGRGRR